MAKRFFSIPWDTRRGDLLNSLLSRLIALCKGEVPFVSSDLNHIYVHFFRGSVELGNLDIGNALDALTNDVYRWLECGRENQRTHERGELDIREADSLQLQTH